MIHRRPAVSRSTHRGDVAAPQAPARATGGRGRHHTRNRIIAACVAAAATLGITPATTGAVASRQTVRWDLNENSRTHVDSVSGIVATSGADVQVGRTYLGAVGIFMPSVTAERRQNEVMPGRLTTAPGDVNSPLNPKSGEWAVEIRAAWTRSYGNLIQKGQNATAGGYFKIELPGGRISCLFKGGDGTQRGVTSAATYNDGAWHTIRCERNADRVRLLVDGQVVRQLLGTVGKIANTAPLSVAGKNKCDQVNVTCDYFDGWVDYIAIFGQ